MDDPDAHIRWAAFDALGDLSMRYDEFVPWAEINQGFTVQGRQVLFSTRAQGIFKPKQMSAALSIKTAIPRAGRESIYRDQERGGPFMDDGRELLPYDLARGGMNKPSNRALLAAWERKAPLIYFLGVRATMYHPIFPVWIAEVREREGRVLLAMDFTSITASTEPDSPWMVREPPAGASYTKRTVWGRDHQSWFSKLTKQAYGWRCALSGLPVRRLLESAHIIPDAEGGPPTADNGICMSAIHHTAFDSNLIGIDPEYRIHVSEPLLAQRDGNMLAALQGLDGKKLRLPEQENDRPRREYLEQRYDEFRGHGH